MSALTIPYIIILLVGLCLILLVLPILFLRKPNVGGCLLSSLGIIVILIIASFLMDGQKIYQCALAVPNQIQIGGNVKDTSRFYLNNYLVLVYRDNVQITKSDALNDKFNTDNPHDGIFGLAFDNRDRLTRCSMIDNFDQARSGRNFLWFGNERTYLQRVFTDIEADANRPLNIDDGKKKYFLRVLPVSQDKLLQAISQYSTYLDLNEDIRVNAPIKIYPLPGSQAVETYFYVRPDLALNSFTPGMNSGGEEVRNAWVKNKSMIPTFGDIIIDNSSINVNNCTGSFPVAIPITATLAFMHEVQFQTNTIPDYDLAKVALKAGPTLGFTQGEIDIKDKSVDVYVPVGKHIVYKLIWQEVWEMGVIEIDLGSGIRELAFRANDVQYIRPELHEAGCP